MRHAFRRGMLALAGAGALACAAALPSHAATAASTPGWRTVKVYPASSLLNDVAATAANNAFVVGNQSNADGTPSSKPVIAARWNGSTWLRLPQLPTAKGFQSAEGANVVAASSASNAWVFAGTTNNSPADYTVAQRWNGTAWVNQSVFPAWTVITSAVTSGPSDAWAFGQVISPFATYAAHYNGHTWTRKSFPILPADVSALSGSDIWVVGEPAGVSAVNPSDFVVEHYDKGAWHKLPAPSFSIPKGDGFAPSRIVAASDTNVWATAQLSHGDGLTPGIVLLHYNGHSWKRVPVPYSVTGGFSLTQDGSGGFWLSAGEVTTTSFANYFFHYASDGKWTATGVPHGENIVVSPTVLAWIHGTKSVWSVGLELSTTSTSSPTQGVILKYGA